MRKPEREWVERAAERSRRGDVPSTEARADKCQQTVSRSSSERSHQPDGDAGRDPRRARGERRRQVDADEDHLRRGAPDEGAMAWNGAPVAIAQPAPGPRAGHRDGVPALRAVRDADRGRERLAGRWTGRCTPRRRGASGSSGSSARYGLELEPRAARSPACRSASGSGWRSCARCSPSPQLLILDEPTAVLTPQAVGASCSSRCASWRPRGARSSTSATSSTRCGRSAPGARCCAAARVTGACDPRTETNRSLSELMLGAAPPCRRRRAVARRR